MTLEQQIQTIDTLLPILFQYQATGQAKMSADETETLKGLYADIFSNYNINVQCVQCVINYLNMLYAYREAHGGPYGVKTEEPTPTPTEEIKPVKSSKKKSQ